MTLLGRKSLLLAYLSLWVTACAPPAPPASQPAEPAAAQLAERFPGAAWRATVDTEGGFTATSYVARDGRDVFRVFCNMPGHRITLQSAHTLPHDQETTMMIRLASSTMLLPARSENLPDGALVFAQLDGDDPNLAALSAPQVRFTVEVEGGPNVPFDIPWDESIAATLAACR